MIENTTTKVKCLPTYLVFDTSGSMGKHTQLLNDTMDHLYTEVVSNPRVSEFAHISVISFNNQAEVVVPMTDLQELQALPQFSCNGLTNYGLASLRCGS